ncbi:MAG: Fe-S cluster assembly sulfur transfer protein SufU, partial [Gammaproteobacteria bacterium]
DRVVEGINPLCGDRITLYLRLNEGHVEDISFKGTGCAISVASSSLMTDQVKGTSVGYTLDLYKKIHRLLTDENNTQTEGLEKLVALSGVRQYPTRVKCASLAWHALKEALTGSETSISTE